MRPTVRILLWACWLLGMYVSFFALGTLLLAPAADLSTRLFSEQVIASAGGPGVLAMVGLGALALSILSRKWLRRLRQRESDALAQHILAELRAGRDPAREFFLYLRAFETTGRLRAPLFSFDLGTLGLGRLRTTELESFVGAALVKAGPLVGLGRPGENLGAGRIETSDEGWRNDIILLAERAKGILLIPSHHAGTLWEMEYLEQQGHLAKTVFVMPPEARAFDWRAHWSRARGAMGPLGASLPEYQDLGLIFSLQPEGGVRDVEPFSLFFQRSFRKSVLKLIGGKPAPDTAGALQRANRRGRRWKYWGRLDFTLRIAATVVFVGLLFSVGHLPGAPREGLGWSTLYDRMQAADEIQNGTARMWSDVESSPLYQQRVRGLPADQIEKLHGQLVEGGTGRLDGGQARTYALAMSQLLRRNDEATCGAVARNTLGADELKMALTRVEPHLVRDWYEVLEAAAFAELQRSSPPPLTAEARSAAEARFEAALSPAERERLRALNASSKPNSVADDCWVFRKKFGAVETMAPPDNLVWARLLIGSGEPAGAPGASAFDELVNSPLYQARIRGLTEAQRTAVTQDLFVKGIARLDDATQLARAASLAELLASADEQTCAAIALGTVTSDQMDARIDRLSEKNKAAFNDSLYRAALAELKQTPPQAITPADLEAAKSRFVEAAFTDADLPRLNRMNGSKPASGPDACWMLRKKYAATMTLPKPYNGILARALAQDKY